MKKTIKFESNTDVRGGQWVFPKTRIPVRYVWEHVKGNWGTGQIKAHFHEVDPNAIDFLEVLAGKKYEY